MSENECWECGAKSEGNFYALAIPNHGAIGTICDECVGSAHDVATACGLIRDEGDERYRASIAAKLGVDLVDAITKTDDAIIRAALGLSNDAEIESVRFAHSISDLLTDERDRNRDVLLRETWAAYCAILGPLPYDQERAEELLAMRVRHLERKVIGNVMAWSRGNESMRADMAGWGHSDPPEPWTPLPAKGEIPAGRIKEGK